MDTIKIMSGGQTGVDRGALDAALEAGVACGGWCPAGRLAEDGALDGRYPLTPLPSRNYADRTRRNVEDSDGTLVIYFGALEGGTALTAAHCVKLAKPHLLVDATRLTRQEAADATIEFIKTNNIASLNLAGPRASRQPDAYDYAREVVALLLGDIEYTAENRDIGC